MIGKPTVFVLGAGASLHYGFPSGYELALRVCRHTKQQNHQRYRSLRELFGDQLVDNFARDFERSGQYSLDAFVERRHEYQDVARVAILQDLMPLEDDARLLSPVFEDGAAAPDWYRYLFGKMIPRQPEWFKQNKLRVITFNFERSFERRMFIALQANYNLNDADCAALANEIPVLHIHGDLGPPAWVPSEEPGAREYRPENTSSAAFLRGLASRISLISDSIPSQRIAIARQWMKEAEVVCFLGFGYHPTNLERLDVKHLGTIVVRGTAMGIEEGELTAITSAFSHQINLTFFREKYCDVLAFLRHIPFIHS